MQPNYIITYRQTDGDTACYFSKENLNHIKYVGIQKNILKLIT